LLDLLSCFFRNTYQFAFGIQFATYTYYQQNVKPKPETDGKKGFVCKVCGYIYEGDELPEDIICPLCKHGAVDFEPIEG
jgi:rubredoxin